MKIYISGPMTGYPEWNRPAFMEAEGKLVDVGFEVLNPARNRIDESGLTAAEQWRAYMRLSVKRVADVDGIALLPGWSESRGASAEIYMADLLGLTCIDVDRWVMIARSRPAAA